MAESVIFFANACLFNPGILALPHIIREAGIIPGCVSILALGALATWTCLALCETLARIRNNARFGRHHGVTSITSYYLGPAFRWPTAVAMRAYFFVLKLFFVMMVGHVVNRLIESVLGTRHLPTVSLRSPAVAADPSANHTPSSSSNGAGGGRRRTSN